MQDNPQTIAGQYDEAAENRFIPREINELLVIAMRVSLAANGAPARCRKKACKSTGRCHFVIASNGDGVCPGGIGEASLDQAAHMVHFLKEYLTSKLGHGGMDDDALEAARKVMKRKHGTR